MANLINCGPPIPIACDVSPFTLNVNSFSTGSGSDCNLVCKSKYVTKDFIKTELVQIPIGQSHRTALTFGMLSCSL